MQYPDLDFNADEIDAFDADIEARKLSMDTEVWRIVIRGMWVSNFGRIKRERVSESGRRTEKIVVGSLNNHGYRNIYVRYSSRFRTMTVHRLVALAFLGPEPKGHQVHHIDGNKQNNRLDNLQYVTQRDNLREAHTRRVERRRLERLMQLDNLANP